MSSDQLATNLNLATFYCGMATRTKGGPLWTFHAKLVPDDMAVSFDHADSFEILIKIFISSHWLKVNNDVVFEAIV